MNALIDTFTVQPFAENTYLLADLDNGAAAVIDPGGRIDEILAHSEKNGLRIEKILGTHGHIDHVAGVAELQAKTGAPYYLHPEAAETLAGLPELASMFGMPPVEVPKVDVELKAGDEIDIGSIRLETRYTPGHAPGHVTFYTPEIETEDYTGPLAFCGDVVFLRSIGRVDLPGGDYRTLMDSIEREILTLPEDCILLSGHGPATRVGEERRENPFIRQWLAESKPLG